MEKRDTNGEHQVKPTLALVPKRKQKRRQEPSMLVDTKRKNDMSKEDTDLATHVALCSERYQGIQGKFDNVEQRLTKIERDVSDIKVQTATGFADVKLLLERQNSSKQIQVIATFGTIITAVLAFVGYLITH